MASSSVVLSFGNHYYLDKIKDASYCVWMELDVFIYCRQGYPYFFGKPRIFLLVSVLMEDEYNSTANVGWRTFIIFAVLNAALVLMVYFFYPEAKGVELEDIPLLFANGGVIGGVFTFGGKPTGRHHE